MEPESSSAKQPLPPEQAAAKAAILAEYERLAEAGITFAAVHFDGAGDEGVSEDIKCYATEDCRASMKTMTCCRRWRGNWSRGTALEKQPMPYGKPSTRNIRNCFQRHPVLIAMLLLLARRTF